MLGYIRGLPLFNPAAKEFYKGYDEALKGLDETRDLALKARLSEEDISALDRHKLALKADVKKSKMADTLVTLGRPFMEGAPIAFTASLFMGWGTFGIPGNTAILVGCSLATFAGLALYLKGLKMGHNCSPQNAFQNVSLSDRLRVGNLMKHGTELLKMAASLTPGATAPAISQQANRMVIGGVVIKRRPDGQHIADSVNAPEKPEPGGFFRP